MVPFRNAIAALIAFASLPDALALPQSTAFSGVWLEVQPKSGPPMRLKLSQTGTQVEVRLSYRESFPDRPFGVAMVQNEIATWTGLQSCAPRFRSSGYDYSKPSTITFTLSWIQPADGAVADPPLLWTQDTEWNAPCGGHLIGTERIQKVLARE